MLTTTLFTKMERMINKALMRVFKIKLIFKIKIIKVNFIKNNYNTKLKTQFSNNQTIFQKSFKNKKNLQASI